MSSNWVARYLEARKWVYDSDTGEWASPEDGLPQHEMDACELELMDDFAWVTCNRDATEKIVKVLLDADVWSEGDDDDE